MTMGEDPSAGSGMPGVSAERVFALVNALAELPSLLSEAGRTALIRLLRPGIATMARQDQRPRLSLLNLVQTCMEHEGGLAELLTAVHLIEGNSVPMLRVLATAHAQFGISSEPLPQLGRGGGG